MLGISAGFLLVNNAALGCVFALGFAGNLLVLAVVLTQKAAHTVINIYLVNLAVADLLHLLSVPPLIHLTIVGSWLWGAGACSVYYMLYYTNWTVSIFIIVAMGFDRYKAVVSPFNSQRYRNRFFAISLLACLWLLGTLAMLPIGLCAHLQSVATDDASNSTVNFCVHSSFEENVTTLTSFSMRRFFLNAEYTSWYLFTVGCLIPAALLASFYGLILRKLHRLRVARASSGGGGGGGGVVTGAAARFERVTLLVTAVILFYLACSLPHWVHVILTLSMEEQAAWMAKTSHLTTLLSYIGSAGNPILYAFLNDSFRTGLGGLLVQAGCSDVAAGVGGGAGGGAGGGGGAVMAGRRVRADGRDLLAMRPNPARAPPGDAAGTAGGSGGREEAAQLLPAAAAPVGTAAATDFEGYLSDGLGLCSGMDSAGQVLETTID